VKKPLIYILIGIAAICVIILAAMPFFQEEQLPAEPSPEPTAPPTETVPPETEPPGAEPETPPPEVELDNVPEGAVFDPETRTFSWQTQPGDAGIYLNVCFRVTDPGGLYDEECINIIVLSSNQGPHLVTIPIQTVDLGSVLTFTIQASDPDGDDLQFFVRNLPPGAVWDPPVFSWYPEEVGVWPGLVVGVTDGEVKTSQQVIIAVR
jgi:hypothetical protein